MVCIPANIAEHHGIAAGSSLIPKGTGPGGSTSDAIRWSDGEGRVPVKHLFVSMKFSTIQYVFLRSGFETKTMWR